MHRRRLLILAAICLYWTGLVLAGPFLGSFLFISDIWRGEQWFEDTLRKEGRKTPTQPDLIFVGIDQASLELASIAEPDEIKSNRAFQLMTARSFPWSREVWSIFMDRVFQAGARAVVIDLVFDTPNDGDAFFRSALDRYRDRVVIGANIDLSHRDQDSSTSNIIVPNVSLIPPPQMEDDRVGFVVYYSDPFDNKIRRALYTLDPNFGLSVEKEKPYVSLAGRALEKMGRPNDVPQDERPHIIRFSEANAYPPHPLWEILDDKLWNANYHKGASLNGKVLLVGPSAQIYHDYHNTPVNPATPGPVLHLQAIAAAMAHEFLENEPVVWDFTGIGIAGLSAWLLIAWLRRPLFCLVTLVVVSALYLAAARVLYDRVGLLILVVPTLAAFLLSGGFSLGFEYVLERLEKLRTRRTLERYVSKNLVKEILDNPDAYYNSMLGSRKSVTVLFSDLVGFTTLVEKSDPSELVPRLNKYLSAMVPMVFNNEGTLDKFIGDAVMAVWGNVSTKGEAEDAKSAVRAALGMRREMLKLNDVWKAEGLDPLAFGVGINHGEAVVGNIGSYEPHERLDPTVIGDAVNLASRLEGLTRIYNVDILLGASVAELVGDEFHLRSVARAQVKGKTLPVDIFTLIGAKDDSVDAKVIEQLKWYEEGIVHFRGRKFPEARAAFDRFLAARPDDFLAKMYRERAVEYEKEPPETDWNAVEVFKKK
jgi:adenylate cyclase